MNNRHARILHRGCGLLDGNSRKAALSCVERASLILIAKPRMGSFCTSLLYSFRIWKVIHADNKFLCFASARGAYEIYQSHIQYFNLLMPRGRS